MGLERRVENSLSGSQSTWRGAAPQREAAPQRAAAGGDDRLHLQSGLGTRRRWGIAQAVTAGRGPGQTRHSTVLGRAFEGGLALLLALPSTAGGLQCSIQHPSRHRLWVITVWQ